MLGAIFGAVTGASKAIEGVTSVVNTLTSRIADARIAAINAKTQEERIAAEERQKSLEMQRDVLVQSLQSRAGLQQAEAGVSIANIITRTFLAAPVGIVLWKIFVWDKAFGQWTGGRTDALSGELWQVITAVIGFYFLYEGAVGITRLIKR